LASELSDEEALKAIFGTYDKQLNAAIWQSSDRRFLKFLKTYEELYELKDKSLASQVIGKKVFIKGSIETALVMIQTSLKQWHFGTKEQQLEILASTFNGKMCIPVIGGAVLSKTANGWRVESIKKYIAQIGDDCSSPLPNFQVLGKDSVGAIFEETAHLSFQPVVKAITIIGTINNEIHELFSLTTGEEYDEDMNATMPYKYKSDLQYLDKGNPLYDIVVHTYGTNEEGKKFDRTNQYRITGFKYVKY